jgi:hypothetical protein
MVPLWLDGLAASQIAELLHPAGVRRWRGAFVSLDASAGVAGVAEAGQRRGRFRNLIASAQPGHCSVIPRDQTYCHLFLSCRYGCRW